MGICGEEKTNRGLRRQESDGDGGAGGKEEERRWLDNIRNDLLERELPGEDAQDRDKWRSLITSLDTYRPHIKVGKDEEGEEEVMLMTELTVSEL